MSRQATDRRRDVLLTVLRQAGRDPGGPVPFETVPHATEVFADRDELLRALHHRWMMLLTARLELVTMDDDGDQDRVAAVAAAWRALAADEPVLRAVLDAHPAGARAAAEEGRLLALWSGLAEPHEPDAEVARVGTAYAALLRAPVPPVRSATRRRMPLSGTCRLRHARA